MNETIASDRRSRRHRTPRMRTVALALLTGLLLPCCGYWILTHRAKRALRDAIAAADRLSPGWRLEEIEAARASPRPNSALRVLDANDLLPPAWKRQRGRPSAPEQQFLAALGSHTHDQCLTAGDVRSLKQTLSVAMPALDQARALAGVPDGRYPITWSSDAVTIIRRPHLDKVRDVATLLLFDALAHAGWRRRGSPVELPRGLERRPLCWQRVGLPGASGLHRRAGLHADRIRPGARRGCRFLVCKAPAPA